MCREVKEESGCCTKAADRCLSRDATGKCSVLSSHHWAQVCVSSFVRESSRAKIQEKALITVNEELPQPSVLTPRKYTAEV